MEKGKFIVIEGLDYAGKTTLATSVVQQLNENGIDTFHASTSSDKNRLTKVINDHILNQSELPNIDTQAMLFAACINDLAVTKIIPALNKGQWVVCERFTLSNRIYQTHSSLTSALTGSIDRQISPDLTIVLDITPQEYQRRLSLRDDKADAMESVNLDAITERRRQYRIQARRDPKTVLIDGTLARHELTAEVLQVIKDKLIDS